MCMVVEVVVACLRKGETNRSNKGHVGQTHFLLVFSFTVERVMPMHEMRGEMH